MVSEITDVLEAIESLSARGEKMALATIVAVRGSTYRRPGARLLVPEDGAPIGNPLYAAACALLCAGALWRVECGKCWLNKSGLRTDGIQLYR